MRGYGKEMMHHKMIRTLNTLNRVVSRELSSGANLGVRNLGVSIGLICSMVAACAGGDTPARTDDLEDRIRAAYTNSVGVGQGGTASGGSAGAVSRAGSTGMGGSRAGSGAGGGSSGSGAGGAATGGSAGSEVVGGGGSGGGEECNGPALLVEACGGGSCHGANSPFTAFAADEDAPLDFVGESGSSTCASNGPLFNPDNPGSSIVIQKVSNDPPVCGQKMPLQSTELSAAEIDCLETWIGTL